jgi:2,4-dienoyl-CoA reductase-like NADH-dependent reductase (Old Yellow Enzyme family)
VGTFENLLAPGRIGSMELRNRIVMAPMGEELAAPDGTVSDEQSAYVEARARGGAGLVMLGSVAVAWPLGTANQRQNGISEDRFLPSLGRLAEAVHAHGAKLALQLTHMGKVARNDMAEGRPMWVPSVPRAVDFDPLYAMVTAEEAEAQLEPMRRPTARVGYHAMTIDDIAQLVAWFADAAERAMRCGVDGVELHAGHGYLIDEFLSPAANARDDGYGGSVDNRARLLLETIAAIRTRVGRDYPVWARINGRELFVAGTTIADARRTAQLMESASADAVHVSAYADPAVAIGFTASHTTHTPEGLVEDARAVKRAVGMPVIAVGRIAAAAADRLIGDGAFDFVAMGRALLADADLPAKLLAGRAADVRPCIYHYRCISQIFVREGVRCAVSPTTGRERELAIEPAATARTVLIAGGGPAGLEAARLCALRGHRVILADAGERLGGRLRLAARTDPTNDNLLRWLLRQVERLDIEVRVATRVDPAVVAAIAPDVVIEATGGRWSAPDVPGRARVRTVDDIGGWLLRGDPIGDGDVVVLGGGRVGLALAELAASQGHKVTVLEPTHVFARELGLPGRWRLVHHLREAGLELIPNATATDITSDGVVFVSGDESHTISADIVLGASPAEPSTNLRGAMPAGVELHSIGDCTGAGFIEGAMLDAATLAVAI